MKRKDSRYYRMIQSWQWHELRRQYLTAHPLCEKCLEQGLYVSATEIHHITPCETALTDADMQRLMFSLTNLQSLCHECHQAEHRRLNSRSRAEIQRRNAARTTRFAERFLDKKDGDYSLISPSPLATNPLTKSRDKLSGIGESVGGGANMTDNEKAERHQDR